MEPVTRKGGDSEWRSAHMVELSAYPGYVSLPLGSVELLLKLLGVLGQVLHAEQPHIRVVADGDQVLAAVVPANDDLIDQFLSMA